MTKEANQMNSQLTSKDWNRINDIILEMNYENDILVALNTFLLQIDKIIPYEKASIYFYTLSKIKLSVDTRIGQGFSEKDLKIYDEYYCMIDDIIGKMLPTKLTTIKSSDTFNLSERKKTEYYSDYIKPVGTHFSLDSNFRWNKNSKGMSFGTLDLFRAENDQDFTERELEICRILQPHMEVKASQYIFPFVDLLDNMLGKFSLTDTESEIARLILRGYTNNQIAREQFITVSTVKKHVASILRKSKSNSRIELICKIKFDN